MVRRPKATAPKPAPSVFPKSWALTPAEIRVVSGLVHGYSTAEIARRNGVSIHTVRTHLKRALGKAGVHSQVALLAAMLAAKT